MKGFTADEREHIKHLLIEEGRELLSHYGLKRTRIADITDAAGIGTSTFYQFFDSKESLYLEVLQRELQEINNEIYAEFQAATSLRDEIHRTLRFVFDELETNPIYYRLIVENEWDTLERRLPNEVIQSHYVDTVETFRAGAERWTKHDDFRADDPEVVINLFRSLAQVVREKDTYDRMGGEGTYAAVRELLIDVITDGLVTTK